MNSQELLALKKAYNQVYQVDEQVDDMGLSDAQRSVNRATNPRNLDVTRASASIAAKKAERIARSMHPTPGTIGVRLADEYDLYDIILSHLLDEGYAETPEAAEAIMVNMSEEWRDSIVEEVLEEGEKPFPYEKVTTQQKKHSAAGNYGNMIKMGLAKRRAKEADKKGGSQQDAGKGWYHGK